MIRILHIARVTTAPAERGISLVAASPGLAVSLVRGTRPGDPVEPERVRRAAKLEGVRDVRTWNAADPHRRMYCTLAFSLRKTRPHIVHVEEEPDSLAALQAVAARRLFAPKARLVLFSWQNVDRPKTAAVRWVQRRTLTAADAVICASRGAVSLLRRLGYPGPTPIIPALPLDPDVFRRRPAPPNDVFTAGFVGRLIPEKGVDTLIDAVGLLGVPIHLRIAGDGPERASLEARVRAAGLERQVAFAGHLVPERVVEFLSSIDVLVVPSRSTAVWQEQYGRVIVEAMGCEVPVVGSDCGAIPEVIADAGLIFPEENATVLAAQLDALRRSPGQRAELARRGRELALAGQTLAFRASQLADFYRHLFATPRGGAR